MVREKGVIVRNVEDKDENHNYVPDDLSNYKLVKQGQFVMNKMKAWQGSYGVSKYNGIVSPAYFVFDFKCDINRDFLMQPSEARLMPFWGYEPSVSVIDGVLFVQTHLHPNLFVSNKACMAILYRSED